jgi:plastocyanin
MVSLSRIAAAAAVILLLSGSYGAAAARKPVTHRLTIEATTFQQPVLNVRVGDTVIWTNNDPFPHTVTSQAGGFDSQAIATGKSWSYKAAKKGEFPYVCTLHPTMKGTLNVK